MSAELDIIRIGENVNLTDEEILKVLKDFKEDFKEEVTVANVTDAIIKLMQIVGRFIHLNGQDKKYVVTKVLLFIVKETDSGKNDEILDKVLISIIPVFIDKLISVENGKLIINPKIKNGCYKLCCFK